MNTPIFQQTMGEVNRAKDRVLELTGAELTDEMNDALSALYAIGFAHGQAESELVHEDDTRLLRELARRATTFVESDDVDDVYDKFKEALELWWERG